MSAVFLRLSRHGLLFLFAKFSVFFAPLLAAGMLSKTVYGSVEWWISLSLVVGSFMSLGSPGVIVYGTVGEEFKEYVVNAIMYVLGVSALLLLLAVLVNFFGLGWGVSSLGPVLLLCALVILQLSFSARLKGLGKGAWSSVIESSLFVSFLLSLLCAHYGYNFVTSWCYSNLFFCLLMILGLIKFIPSQVCKKTEFDFFALIKASGPFLLGGSLMGVFIAAPRIFLGFFAGPDAVAEFSLAFRWLSVSIVVHQFLNTVFFRKIFSGSNIRFREFFLSASLMGVALVSFGMLLTLYFLDGWEAEIPMPSPLKDVALISLGVVLWAGTACFEGLLYREGETFTQVRAVLLASISLFAFLLGAFYFFPKEHAVYGVSCAWVFSFFVLISMQYFGLVRLGIKMPYLVMALSGSVLSYVAMEIILW